MRKHKRKNNVDLTNHIPKTKVEFSKNYYQNALRLYYDKPVFYTGNFRASVFYPDPEKINTDPGFTIKQSLQEKGIIINGRRKRYIG